MGDVVPLPKRKRLQREQADTLRQLIFDFGLNETVQAEIDNAIYRHTVDPSERWLFVKISPEQFGYVVRAIYSLKMPDLTLRVWNAALVHLRMDTGEILADRERPASDAHTLPCHVSTAMTALTKIGAILKTRRGKRVVYSINPNVGWNGGEGTRQTAAKEAPKLRLVSNCDEKSPA
ncbi:MAG: hypothetical protein FD153_45 [Rhodospirillaceae bacterium]|nr:MAG: hypothetical protein FD153_45 [Rhodospirillaceae bacterium]